MFELNGKYNTAKIFTDNVEQTAISQIIDMCGLECFKDCTIRIMPDVHAGNDCVIGTTIKLKDKVIPNLVGNDIGCGMFVIKIKEKQEDLDLFAIDEYVTKYFSQSGKYIDMAIQLTKDLRCSKFLNQDKINSALGTLGNGNHFFEINQDNKGDIYFVVHSGSRNLGAQICKYYQNKGYEEYINTSDEKVKIIQTLTKQGKQQLIQQELKKIQKKTCNKNSAYVQGQTFNDYIHDMNIVQKYATENRKLLVNGLINNLSLTNVEEFSTIHNYIDVENLILRKGSISARNGEKLIIPINMRDGSIIGIGKGNIDWNYSGPHGAGRILSRSQAKKQLNFNEYKQSMKDIFTTSIREETIDEAPMAYKPIEEILNNIVDAIDIVDIIKPIYNFKC